MIGDDAAEWPETNEDEPNHQKTQMPANAMFKSLNDSPWTHDRQERGGGGERQTVAEKNLHRRTSEQKNV